MAESCFMKRIRYSKYVPDPAGEMSMEDLLSALSDYLLQSGFQDSMWYELPQDEQTLDELKRAITHRRHRPRKRAIQYPRGAND